MPTLGSTELIILLIVVLVLFGAKRLPDSARSLGRSLRIFKAETRGLRDDADGTVPPRAAETTVTAQPLPPAPDVRPTTPSPTPEPAAEQTQHPLP